MLHILLLILKIIGIILLAVLIVLLLLFLTVAAAPLKYRAEGSCAGSADTIYGRIRFQWLFHLISGEAVYENGRMKWTIRAAWKRMGGLTDSEKEENAPSFSSGKEQKKPEKERKSDTETHRSDSVSEPRVRKETDRKNFERTSTAASRGEEKKKNVGERKTMFQRLGRYADKIKYTFRKICDKIKTLARKKERLKAFIENEIHRKAFSRVVKEAKRLFGFLNPDKLHINLEFGCRNPEYTGYILAGIGMVYPMIGQHIDVSPDFERRILKGDAYVEGKFRIMYTLIVACNLLLDKNVRITYRHIRKFKL